VPVAATPHDVLPWVAGDQEAVTFATLTGRRLDHRVPLRAQDVADGAVLVLVPGGTAFGGEVQPTGVPDEAPHPSPHSTALVVGATVVLVGAAACVLVDRLALVAGAVVFAQAAAVAGWARPGEGRWVWLIAAGLVAAITGGTLVAGAPASAAWAVLACIAVLALRVLPSLVIVLPDEAPLDIDRPAPGQSNHATPETGVIAEIVARGQRFLAAGTVATGLIAAVSVAALLRAPGAGSATWGAWTLAAAAGGALLLGARAYRGAGSRYALRLGGAAALTSLGAATLGHVPDAGLWVVLAASVAMATGSLGAAVALGRGWRSARWGQVADVLEGMAVTVSPPAALVAAGGFEYVRQWVS
jgi:hypothetical protein